MLYHTSILALALLVLPAAELRAQLLLETPMQTFARTTGEQIGRAVQAGQELARSKRETTLQIRAARAMFFASCERGDRDAQAEARFAELLWAKDIVFLSHYVAFGVTTEARRHLDAMERMTGHLDAGISNDAMDAFEAWVNAVRASLGARRPGPPVNPSPSSFLAAIVSSQAEYDRYRAVRDHIEFAIWHNSRRGALAPPAVTPEERADAYITMVAPGIVAQRLAALSAAERGEAERRIRDWMIAGRAAIIAYEGVPVTLEPSLAELGSLYPAPLLQQMVDYHARLVARGSPSEAAVVHTLARGITQNDRRLGVPDVPMGEVRLRRIEESARDAAFAASPAGTLSDVEAAAVRIAFPGWPQHRQPHRLNYLAGPGQPGRGRRLDYLMHRAEIVGGRLRPPAWAPDARIDPCTGAAVTRTTTSPAGGNVPVPRPTSAAAENAPLPMSTIPSREDAARSLLPQQRRQ